MREKLQHLIKSEGLTASRFAEILEIQPAGVSHILAGRNKPSFDLLQKILRRFPKINPDWLLLDSEQMYRDGWNDAENLTGGSAVTNSLDGTRNLGGLFNSDNGGVIRETGIGYGKIGDNFRIGSTNPSSANRGDTSSVTQNSSLGEAHISAEQGMGAALSHSRAGSPIQKIAIFYADGTFEAYFPSINRG